MSALNVIHITRYDRFLLLRKRPTLLKLISAIAVVAGLVLSLIPTVARFDEKTKTEDAQFFAQPIGSRIVWPMVFMLGFVSPVEIVLFL